MVHLCIHTSWKISRAPILILYTQVRLKLGYLGGLKMVTVNFNQFLVLRRLHMHSMSNGNSDSLVTEPLKFIYAYIYSHRKTVFQFADDASDLLERSYIYA